MSTLVFPYLYFSFLSQVPDLGLERLQIFSPSTPSHRSPLPLVRTHRRTSTLFLRKGPHILRVDTVPTNVLSVLLRTLNGLHSHLAPPGVISSKHSLTPLSLLCNPYLLLPETWEDRGHCRRAGVAIRSVTSTPVNFRRRCHRSWTLRWSVQVGVSPTPNYGDLGGTGSPYLRVLICEGELLWLYVRTSSNYVTEGWRKVGGRVRTRDPSEGSL